MAPGLIRCTALRCVRTHTRQDHANHHQPSPPSHTHTTPPPTTHPPPQHRAPNNPTPTPNTQPPTPSSPPLLPHPTHTHTHLTTPPPSCTSCKSSRVGDLGQFNVMSWTLRCIHRRSSLLEQAFTTAQGRARENIRMLGLGIRSSSRLLERLVFATWPVLNLAMVVSILLID